MRVYWNGFSLRKRKSTSVSDPKQCLACQVRMSLREASGGGFASEQDIENMASRPMSVFLTKESIPFLLALGCVSWAYGYGCCIRQATRPTGSV